MDPANPADRGTPANVDAGTDAGTDPGTESDANAGTGPDPAADLAAAARAAGLAPELAARLRTAGHGPDGRPLLTAVTQDATTGRVLMVAWMDGEALARTLQTGIATYWSRSRQELWVKGATSGSTQHVVDVSLDCDGDAILVRVHPDGPACHTGAPSCFDTLTLTTDPTTDLTTDPTTSGEPA